MATGTIYKNDKVTTEAIMPNVYPYNENQTIRVTKRNGIVSLKLYVLSSSAPTRQTITLFTLAEKYRPASNMSFNFIDNNTGYITEVNVTSTGEVTAYIYNKDSNDAIRLNNVVTYVAAE